MGTEGEGGISLGINTCNLKKLKKKDLSSKLNFLLLKLYKFLRIRHPPHPTPIP